MIRDYQLTNIIRDNEIFKAYLKKGKIWGFKSKMAFKYGISRERVSQIIEKKLQGLDK
jgi:hypothetical protein